MVEEKICSIFTGIIFGFSRHYPFNVFFWFFYVIESFFFSSTHVSVYLVPGVKHRGDELLCE